MPNDDHDQVAHLNEHLDMLLTLCPDCTAKVDAAQAADPTAEFTAVKGPDGLWHAVPA